MLPLIDQAYENSKRRIGTSVLNEVIQDAIRLTPPPSHHGKRLKILYTSQVATKTTYVCRVCKRSELLHFSYKRYLENALRRAFNFDGTPIRILVRKRGA
ncbi:hypothetical protein MGH68_09680 [Erysipelothrix sp. D19-032]